MAPADPVGLDAVGLRNTGCRTRAGDEFSQEGHGIPRETEFKRSIYSVTGGLIRATPTRKISARRYLDTHHAGRVFRSPVSGGLRRRGPGVRLRF